MKLSSTNIQTKLLFTLVFLIFSLSFTSCQVKIPDRFVKSGINIALNQKLFEDMTKVFEAMFKNLSSTKIGLTFPHILNLKIQNDSQNSNSTINLVDWNIENFNIDQFDFDVDSTNFVLIEPSQKIKMYFSNLNMEMSFVSNFSSNPHILEYQEIRNCNISIQNISFTTVYQLKIDNETKALQIVIDQILISGIGEKILFSYDDEGLFIHQVAFMFNILKDYVMININTLLNDFKDPIQEIVDLTMQKISKYYLEASIFNDIKGFFGLESPPGQQYSPLIFDNYLAIQDYGYIYRGTPNITGVEFENYLPLYLNIISTTQVFISQQTVNQFLLQIQQSQNYQFSFPFFLGLIECDTSVLNTYFSGFDSAFGPSKKCLYNVKSVEPIRMSFAAGDNYIENNTYTMNFFYLEDYSVDTSEPFLTFNISIRSIIFGFNVTQSLIYYYELKNFFITDMQMTYTSKSSFTFDSNSFLTKMNSTYKDQLRLELAKVGQAGNQIPSSIFGKRYQQFFTSYFNNSELGIKHQYAQLTIANDGFTDYSLFLDGMYFLLKSINNTIYGTPEFKNKLTLDALYYLGGLEQFTMLSQNLPKIDRDSYMIKPDKENTQSTHYKTGNLSKKRRRDPTFVDSLYDQFQFITSDLSHITNKIAKAFRFGSTENSDEFGIEKINLNQDKKEENKKLYSY